jgi:hypothetical protein
MNENKDQSEGPLDALSRMPIGSPQSRAAARAAVESSDGSPDIYAQFVSYASVKSGHYEFRRATWNDREWTRDEGESREAFEQRVEDSLQVSSVIPKGIFWYEQ